MSAPMDVFAVPGRFFEVLLAFEWEGYRYLTTVVVRSSVDWAAVMTAEARTVVAFGLPAMHALEMLRVREVREEEAVVVVRGGVPSWHRMKLGAGILEGE
jgi:hypothetical protein